MDTKDPSPKTLQQAIQYFSDPETCLHFIMPIVWPDGVACSHCGGKSHSFISTRSKWFCKGCKKQFSVKTGTIMEDSPLGLDKWLVAMWLIGNAKNGISSYEIHRALGITQKTAWFLLHRIRVAMAQGTFKKLSGTVEADETHLGGLVSNYSKAKRKELTKEAKKLKPGRPVNLSRVVKKSIVMGMLERGNGEKPSQIRAQVIGEAKRPHIKDLVRENVEHGSFVMTDAAPVFKGLQDEFIHMSVNHAIRYAEGRIHTGGVENFWSLLTRTLQGTYVSVEPTHLEAYLDEQTFRFNCRKLNDGQRHLCILACIAGRRLTYKALTGKTDPQ